MSNQVDKGKILELIRKVAISEDDFVMGIQLGHSQEDGSIMALAQFAGMGLEVPLPEMGKWPDGLSDNPDAIVVAYELADAKVKALFIQAGVKPYRSRIIGIEDISDLGHTYDDGRNGEVLH